MQTADKEPCQGRSRLGKLKCTGVVPKHAGDSRRSCRNIYKRGDYVAIGGKYTQCRNKSTGTTQVADERKPNTIKYSWGKKRNGRRDMNNNSTDIRAAQRCRKGRYRMVSANKGCENVWAGSYYTGVIKKTYKIAGRCWGGVDKVRRVQNTSGGSSKFAGICGYGKGGRGIENISFNVKIQQFVCCSKSLWGCDRFHGGVSIGRKAVDIQATMRQAMHMA